MKNNDEWVTVARLSKTRGLRGELLAFGLSDRPGRYRELTRVFLFDQTDKPVRQGAPFEVERVWEHQGRLVFKFRGVESISEAEELEGADVRLPLEERAPLPDGEYYQSDIIGCEVVDRATNRAIGKVRAWHEFGGPPLLEVKPDEGSGEVLIPFAKSICVEIDPGNRKIAVELPEGLGDLNRS